MNDKIINNLYEFWEHIGKLTNRLVKTQEYTTVSMDKSDWPNRVFAVKNSNEVIEKVVELSQKGKLPEIITIAKPNSLNNSNAEFLFGQKNMALDLKLVSDNITINSNIKRAKTKEDAINFAKIASESFKYRVDHNVISEIVTNSEKVKLFIYQEENELIE